MKLYKHSKTGNIYEKIAEAVHTETGEKLIVYKPLNKYEFYVRPKDMFNEKVEIDGQLVSRFQLYTPTVYIDSNHVDEDIHFEQFIIAKEEGNYVYLFEIFSERFYKVHVRDFATDYKEMKCD